MLNPVLLITDFGKKDAVEKYYSPDQVCDLVPGMTKNNLAQLRFTGRGPRFLKPSPRKVVYAASAIEAWLASSEQTQTGQAVSA